MAGQAEELMVLPVIKHTTQVDPDGRPVSFTLTSEWEMERFGEEILERANEKMQILKEEGKIIDFDLNPEDEIPKVIMPAMGEDGKTPVCLLDSFELDSAQMRWFKGNQKLIAKFLSDLFEELLFLEENGFLQFKLLISRNTIIYDPSANKFKFVFFPITRKNTTNCTVFRFLEQEGYVCFLADRERNRSSAILSSLGQVAAMLLLGGLPENIFEIAGEAKEQFLLRAVENKIYGSKEDVSMKLGTLFHHMFYLDPELTVERIVKYANEERSLRECCNYPEITWPDGIYWSEGEPPKLQLHAAVLEGNGERAEWLLKQGADINARDGKGRTLLVVAVEKGDHEMAKFLIAHGADINARDGGDRTLLHLAVEENDDEMAKFLIAHGADINARDGGDRTLLHLAVEENDGEMAKFLIKHGADISARDKSDKTAYMLAAELKNPETLELFLPAVMKMCNFDFKKALNYLLMMINKEDADKEILRVITKSIDDEIKKAPSIIKKIIYSITQVGGFNSVSYDNFFRFYKEQYKNDNKQLAYLIQSGADFSDGGFKRWVDAIIEDNPSACNYTNPEDGSTLFHMVLARPGMFPVFFAVLCEHADLQNTLFVTDHEGYTPLQRFIMFNDYSMVRRLNDLLSRYAKKGKLQSIIQTGLSFFIWSKPSCDPCSIDFASEQSGKKTALHLAMEHIKNQDVCYKCVALLLEAGADPFVLDAEGKLPIHLRGGFGYENASIFRLFIAHGLKSPGDDKQFTSRGNAAEFNRILKNPQPPSW